MDTDPVLDLIARIAAKRAPEEAPPPASVEILIHPGIPKFGQSRFTPMQIALRRMVLDSVSSPHTRRNYAKAIDDLFRFTGPRPLSRTLLQEYKVGIEALAPSTINVRLSAVRKLVGEARKNGMIGSEDAANLTDIPNVRQQEPA